MVKGRKCASVSLWFCSVEIVTDYNCGKDGGCTYLAQLTLHRVLCFVTAGYETYSLSFL